MKFPFVCVVLLFAIIATFFAGCSSTPSSPGTGTLSSGILPGAAGTPVVISELSQLVLSPSEIPFIVADEKNQTPDLKNPAFSRFGAIRGYTRYSINEKEDSATSVQLGQIIVEYPPGNAALAFAAFVTQSRNADQTRYKLTWLQDPGIGDQSCAFIVTDSANTSKTTAMIVFTKSTIMESVVMISPSPDTDALTRAARQAAAKIPS